MKQTIKVMTELTEEIYELKNKINKMYEIANNAIYFNDSSDYLSALYEVCMVIAEDEDKIGEEFIGEDEDYEYEID